MVGQPSTHLPFSPAAPMTQGLCRASLLKSLPPFHALGPRASCSLVLDPGPLISLLPQPPGLQSHLQSRPHSAPAGSCESQRLTPKLPLLTGSYCLPVTLEQSPALSGLLSGSSTSAPPFSLPLLWCLCCSGSSLQRCRHTCLSPHLPGCLSLGTSSRELPTHFSPFHPQISSHFFWEPERTTRTVGSRPSLCIRKWAERG